MGRATLKVGTGNPKSIVELFSTHFAVVFDDENLKISVCSVRYSFLLLSLDSTFMQVSRMAFFILFSLFKKNQNDDGDDVRLTVKYTRLLSETE